MDGGMPGGIGGGVPAGDIGGGMPHEDIGGGMHDMGGMHIGGGRR
jgi:hypothetical protein